MLGPGNAEAEDRRPARGSVAGSRAFAMGRRRLLPSRSPRPARGNSIASPERGDPAKRRGRLVRGAMSRARCGAARRFDEKRTSNAGTSARGRCPPGLGRGGRSCRGRGRGRDWRRSGFRPARPCARETPRAGGSNGRSHTLASARSAGAWITGPSAIGRRRECRPHHVGAAFDERMRIAALSSRPGSPSMTKAPNAPLPRVEPCEHAAVAAMRSAQQGLRLDHVLVAAARRLTTSIVSSCAPAPS